MAIVIEERKTSNASALVNFFLWLFVLGIIGAAAYYIFFAQPQLVEFAAPRGFEGAQQISQIQVSVDEVMQDPRFTSLKQYVTIPEGGSFGKPNPFLGF